MLIILRSLTWIYKFTGFQTISSNIVKNILYLIPHYTELLNLFLKTCNCKNIFRHWDSVVKLVKIRSQNDMVCNHFKKIRVKLHWFHCLFHFMYMGFWLIRAKKIETMKKTVKSKYFKCWNLSITNLSIIFIVAYIVELVLCTSLK